MLSFEQTQDFETKFGAQAEEMFVSIEMIETFLQKKLVLYNLDKRAISKIICIIPSS